MSAPTNRVQTLTPHTQKVVSQLDAKEGLRVAARVIPCAEGCMPLLDTHSPLSSVAEQKKGPRLGVPAF